MRMQMRYSGVLKPTPQQTRLSQVDHVPQETTVRLPSHRSGDSQSLRKPERGLHHRAKGCHAKGHPTRCKQNAGARRLLFVRRVYQVARWPRREPDDFQAPSFECLDLAADKTVADFGVLIDEISNFQAVTVPLAKSHTKEPEFVGFPAPSICPRGGVQVRFYVAAQLVLITVSATPATNLNPCTPLASDVEVRLLCTGAVQGWPTP